MSRFASLALLALALLIAPASFAAPILSGVEYFVLDHPAGGDVAPPNYALRLDGLDGDENHDFTFSATAGGASLTILLDAPGDTLTISGTLFGGEVDNNAFVDPQLWSVNFVYSGLTDSADELQASAGGGTITALGLGGNPVAPFAIGESFNLGVKANGAGEFFILDRGHRIPGDNETPTATGWLMHDGIEQPVVAQDWLFVVGDPVPEPSTAMLVGIGLFVIAGRRFRHA